MLSTSVSVLHRTGRVQVHRQDGERSSPDSGDLPAILGGYADWVPGGDGAVTDTPAAGAGGASAARPGLIDRHDLVAALDHAAGKRVTIISPNRPNNSSSVPPIDPRPYSPVPQQPR
jgi:hypothetical protein